MLDEYRDTLGLIMTEQGVDISSPQWGSNEFGAAVDVLNEQIASGQIRQVKGNSYKEDLIAGDAVAVICWSGDITQLNDENGDRWEFAIPEAGGTLWSDNMMVPIGAPSQGERRDADELLLRSGGRGQVAAYVNFICPVQGAQEAMEQVDPELVSDTNIFPDEATLAKVKIFRTLTPQEETDFAGQFQSTIGN